MPHASFNGLRVLSLESRRARETEKLIRTYGGEPTVVPAMRELPLSSQAPCFAFAEALLAGRYELLVFMTGVGVRAVVDIASTRYDRDDLLAALRRVGDAGGVAARGTKPQGALKEMGIAIACVAPEPMTWREMLTTLETHYGADRLRTMRAAVQEYGATNPELIAALSERCRTLDKVAVYQWGLPEDLSGLRGAVQSVIDGTVDVVLFMTAVQVTHLFDVARQMGLDDDLRRGLQALVVISIGPTTTEELQHHGLQPDFEPSRPKMGFLVNEAAEYAGRMLAFKRASLPPVADAAEQPLEHRPAVRPGTTAEIDGSGAHQIARSVSTGAGLRDALLPFDILHEISSRIASADPLHAVLERIVAFVTTVVPCDSCFVYTREDDKLVLRASKNPHANEVDRLGMAVGEGVTGWVAQHRQPVSLAAKASEDPRFSPFNTLPEDRFEAMLSVPILCANRVVGVLNVQHRETYTHTDLQIRLLATIGFLVGAEMERARLETENLLLTNRLETRKTVDRAKGILQRDLGISEEEAYRTMQAESRRRRKNMRDIAEAVLLSDDLRKGLADA